MVLEHVQGPYNEQVRNCRTHHESIRRINKLKKHWKIRKPHEQVNDLDKHKPTGSRLALASSFAFLSYIFYCYGKITRSELRPSPLVITISRIRCGFSTSQAKIAMTVENSGCFHIVTTKLTKI